MTEPRRLLRDDALILARAEPVLCEADGKRRLACQNYPSGDLVCLYDAGVVRIQQQKGVPLCYIGFHHGRLGRRDVAAREVRLHQRPQWRDEVHASVSIHHDGALFHCWFPERFEQDVWLPHVVSHLPRRRLPRRQRLSSVPGQQPLVALSKLAAEEGAIQHPRGIGPELQRRGRRPCLLDLAAAVREVHVHDARLRVNGHHGIGMGCTRWACLLQGLHWPLGRHRLPCACQDPPGGLGAPQAAVECLEHRVPRIPVDGGLRLEAHHAAELPKPTVARHKGILGIQDLSARNKETDGTKAGRSGSKRYRRPRRSTENGKRSNHVARFAMATALRSVARTSNTPGRVWLE
mmetsp:Transcript_22472/g.62360  ORF Transcript_22472/g.62360 Transcript_22472/m.62360 type:complete len:349 (-) Transcript_22472:434-1480(-)